VNGIAILSRGRSSALPELASAQEQGLTGFEATTWFALFLPAHSPPAVVQKLNAAAIAVLEDPAVQKQLSEIGGSVVATERRSPEYLGRFLKSEIEKWASAVKAAGISLD
jgi:tripartite-type tricarboxylate transporter receptor subunit TctC